MWFYKWVYFELCRYLRSQEAGFVMMCRICMGITSGFSEKIHPNPNLDCRIWGLGRSPGSPKVTSTCEHRCQIEPPGRINPIVLPSSMGTSGPSPLSERSVDSI